jgi:hypothetical protein
MGRSGRLSALVVVAAVVAAMAACVAPDAKVGERHRWWAQLGPVLPHDTFPADCKLCHVGDGWNVLTDDFKFDHLKQTGVPLEGAHATASCLRCHNDRGPVSVFNSKGCVGCHADVHQGDLGHDCTRCHGPDDWRPKDPIGMHYRTRFPLTASHVSVACHKCHPGANVGNFMPTDTECVTCHRSDLVKTNNPPHIPLGWINHCERCHMPTDWHNAEFK